MNTPEDLPALPVTFYPNRLRMFWVLLLCCALMATAVFMFFDDSNSFKHPAILNKFFGVLSMVTFGVCIFGSLYGMIFQRPLFSITSKGIERNKYPLVAWDDIAEVKLIDAAFSGRNNNRRALFVGIFLKDMEKYGAGLKPSARTALKMLAQMPGTPVIVSA